MNRSLPTLTLALLVLGFEACNRSNPSQSKEAVEQAVRQYLETRAGLDVKAMDVRVATVSFRENEADATVSFNAKGTADPNNSMTMKYVLEFKDNKWSVKGRSGTSEHGATVPGQGMPPNHPVAPEGKK